MNRWSSFIKVHQMINLFYQFEKSWNYFPKLLQYLRSYQQHPMVDISPESHHHSFSVRFSHSSRCKLFCGLNLHFLSTLTWKIPWMEEPGGLQSMGSLRVGHDWATSIWLFTFMHWRRKWHPTPVLLPGKSHGWRSPVGCRLWGRTESDTIAAT